MSGIYIVKFEDYPDNIYKIGRSKNIEERIKQFKNNTVILGNVDLIYYKEFEDTVKAEKCIHTLLKEYRYKENKEFFKGDINFFIKQLDTLNQNDFIISPKISREYTSSYIITNNLKEEYKPVTIKDMFILCQEAIEVLTSSVQVIKQLESEIEKLKKEVSNLKEL